MGDLTTTKSKPPARPGTLPARLPPYQVLDRVAPLAGASETLRPSMMNYTCDSVGTFEYARAAVLRARAAIDNGDHRRAVDMLRRAMAPATTAEIREAIEEAVRRCTRKPSGLDVEAYSVGLMADIAHMHPSRIEFAMAMIKYRFASGFLPETSDIAAALDAVREDHVMLPSGLCMSPREVLAAIEALPERLASAGPRVERLEQMIRRCIDDMDKLPPAELRDRYPPKVLHIARRYKEARARAALEGPESEPTH
jgi:hypothetical protein